MNEVLIMAGKDLIDLAVDKFSKENKVLMVLDFSGHSIEDKAKYLDLVKSANILTEEQTENARSTGALIIVIPYFTTNIAIQDYRKIKHATRFISLWVDGIKYEIN
ncbi:MAG: hypothetical protein IJS60_08275 [Abditibacteriota bacterium]|nr:hypothetical protein [Abditibacteriota bacterium]